MISPGTNASNLRSLTERWGSMDVERLIRADLSPLSFQDLQEPLTAVIAMSKQLQEAAPERLPEPVAGLGCQAYEPLSGAAETVLGLNAVQVASSGQNLQELRNHSHQQLRRGIETFWKLIPPVAAMAFAYSAVGERANTQAELEALSQEYRRIIAQGKGEGESIRRLLTDLQQDVNQYSISSHAGVFQKQAESHWWRGLFWLAGTVLFAAMMLTAVGANLNRAMADPADTAFHPNLFAAKSFAFVVLLSGTFWCGRMFRAAKHNEALNRQRAASLQSFQTFVDSSAADEQTKATILVHAAQAVFAHQPTGFVPDAADSTPQVLELVRMISPPKSGIDR